MELGTIRHINIDVEMQASYLDYAMSVIVARALPDVRDGLKPVHRRVLYAMHDLGLSNDKPYKKSARIVGEVLGKYHPHGDVPVYEAMVRMAQDFSLRYPLVDGQGNFGSVDGDNAAAMRYTEARLAAISAEMLADIQKDTVDWVDNFDGTLREPAVLPAALPNLLINGGSGIAVGMSTNIPPHNLNEICDALCYLIDNYHRVEDVTIEDLMRFIPGPDFPTGGVIYRYQHEGNGGDTERVDMIAKAYASGRGRIVVQAKAHIEDMSRNRSRIVVTELPYQTNKASLLERIAELVRDGRLEGITDLRDESDRTGMRICIEMTRTVEPREVLGELFKLTPLESTFGVSLLALVDGEPRVLSLKRILQHFLEHRQEVIVRRSKHDLEKARQRAHILEGLLRALDVLDEVIALIRRSRTADTAKGNLMEQFKFTELQAQAILDMQLRRLAALERRKLQDEYRETIALIRELEELLASPEKVLALIKRDLNALKTHYGDARRTQIADRVKGTLTAMDVLPDQEVWITLATDGTLARRVREPITVSELDRLAQDANLALAPAHTRHDLYLFSAKGQATRVPIHQIPEATGVHFADVSGLTRRDRVVSFCTIPISSADEPVTGYLLAGTVQGKVKRVALADLVAQAHTNPQIIGMDAGDELVWVDVSAGGGEILLVSASGQAIRFSEEVVRPMGLAAGGVGGIKLQAKDRVVAGQGLDSRSDPQANLAVFTTTGYGKQVPLAEFPLQGRNGQGVVAIKLVERAGEVAGAALVLSGESIVCLLDGAPSRVLAAGDLPRMGRSAQGKAALPLAANDRVWHIYAVATTDAGEPPRTRPVAGKESKAKRRSKAAAKASAVTAQSTPSPAPERTRGRARATTEAAPAIVQTPKQTGKTPKAGASEPAPIPAAKPARKATKSAAAKSSPAKPAAARDRLGAQDQPALSEELAPAKTTKRSAAKAPPKPTGRKTYSKAGLPRLAPRGAEKPEPAISQAPADPKGAQKTPRTRTRSGSDGKRAKP
jgi:DNA gyrase subunit A